MKKIILVLLLSGCTQINPVASSLSPEQVKIRQEFKKIESLEDKETIYTLFAGAAEYLHKAKLDNSCDFDPLLGKVQSTYGWDREKYPKFTDSVSDFLISRGYEDPRDLSKESDREWLANMFRDLAEATRKP